MVSIRSSVIDRTAKLTETGIDMMGHYILEHFHPVLAQGTFSGLEFNPLEKDIGIHYSKPMPQMSLTQA